jgi:predicted nuclease with TOPRIM domain
MDTACTLFCCFSLLQGQSQEATLRELLEQNRLLRDQARAQQTQINELKQRIEQLAVSQSEHDEKWATIQAASKEVPIPRRHA